MKQDNSGISRRSLIKGVGALGALGAFTAMAGCAPSQSGAAPSNGNNDTFDEETEIVFAGAGTGIFGAMAAKKAGRDVIVLEKGATYGGTTFLSEKGFWVPANHLQSEEARAKDIPESVAEYMMACDLYHTASKELCLDFARNAGEAHRYVNEELGVPMETYPGYRDYYLFPGYGWDHTIDIKGEWSDLRPIIDSYNLDLRTGTEVTDLITNDEGAVVGVVAVSNGKTTRIKASCGVVLATGGFDHNEQMRKAFLRGPLVGTVVVPTNTGDGHRMGMVVGADFVNMPSLFSTVSFVTGAEGLVTDPKAFDHFGYRFSPGSIIVNKFGKRFCDEGSSYDVVGTALTNLDANGLDPALSGPATFVFDSGFVDYYGFPGGVPKDGEPPAWVRTYQTLEELADGEGIEKEAFLEEVSRFATFCETGVDLDFHRGESGWELPGGIGEFYMDPQRDDLPNKYLAKIETPPFYAAKIGLGSFSTSGGLAVNEHAQVLRNGEPIPGLYAAGCTAAALVSGYPGGGFSIGSGCYRGMKAANHALGLGLFD